MLCWFDEELIFVVINHLLQKLKMLGRCNLSIIFSTRALAQGRMQKFEFGGLGMDENGKFHLTEAEFKVV